MSELEDLKVRVLLVPSGNCAEVLEALFCGGIVFLRIEWIAALALGRLKCVNNFG